MKLNSIIKYNFFVWILLIVMLTNTKCKHDLELAPDPDLDPIECDTTNITFSETIWRIIETNCYGCHSGAVHQGVLLLLTIVR